MYSTCLFCHTSLGANEAVENFPIGRRLAFDAAKGRLWVVCSKCERWNLTPIEERWEAIEECERSFRGTKLRTSTDEIGLARLSEGLELVRIGKPLRPEFAAWRYGDQFGRRRRNNMIRMGIAVTAGVMVPQFGVALGASFAAVASQTWNIMAFGQAMYLRTRIAARTIDTSGNILNVRAQEVDKAIMLQPALDEPWGLRIRHRSLESEEVPWWKYARDHDETDIRGEEAVRLAGQLLPRLNEGAGSRVHVEDALKMVVETDDVGKAFARASALARQRWYKSEKGPTVASLSPALRLALEMMSHEDAERRALEGELAVLEDAWREAEEIASISDNLFLPAAVSEQLNAIKGRE